MVNGLGDLEGTVAGSQLPACQYTLQRVRGISDAVSFALAVFPMVRGRVPLGESLRAWQTLFVT